MHSIDSSSDTRAALHSGAPSGSRAALHSGDPVVGGAGLGPAGSTDAAVGASSVYLRTPSAPPAGRRDSQVFEGHGVPSADAAERIGRRERKKEKEEEEERGGKSKARIVEMRTQKTGGGVPVYEEAKEEAEGGGRQTDDEITEAEAG